MTAKKRTRKKTTTRTTKRKAAPTAVGVHKNGHAAVEKRSQALVLVVDDYQDAREMCSEFLAFSGFQVAEARDGLEAIEKARALLPDVILMDLSLPRMDGWEATRQLKQDERTREIPVVALTGHALAGHSDGAKEAGCDSFLTKPCLPDQMVAEVRRMLDLTRKNER